MKMLNMSSLILFLGIITYQTSVAEPSWLQSLFQGIELHKSQTDIIPTPGAPTMQGIYCTDANPGLYALNKPLPMNFSLPRIIRLPFFLRTSHLITTPIHTQQQNILQTSYKCMPLDCLLATVALGAYGYYKYVHNKQ